ncbi:Protein farnesyltransferase subunit beta [Vitis vinifera]|uniref:Protein farnesyltransferase subunit beta n=1 Tax=Vitis vinifera TaxID=29760 RepID=A0A438JIV5_VITVI|nr:Protein farnesyltransferase subunit beta [Vitis vinifera]
MDSSETQSPTVTQREQWMVESQVFQMYELLSSVPRNAQSVLLELQRDKHIEFLTNGLRQLGPSFCVLDAKYSTMALLLILHSIALLGDSVDDELENNTIDFLSRCQNHKNAEYKLLSPSALQNLVLGGRKFTSLEWALKVPDRMVDMVVDLGRQMPHLATTYAAINALITLGGHRSLSSINRGKVYTFLRRMKDPSGAFRMHDAGEMDVRACYTAISVASVLNILDDELVKGVGNFILSCQTYEGGISGEPGSEAHGGYVSHYTCFSISVYSQIFISPLCCCACLYTFCGLATMVLIGEVNRLDLTSLISEFCLFWNNMISVGFEMNASRIGWYFDKVFEGGFQGRTNKLVDGCYSFWQEQLRLLDAGGSAIDSPHLLQYLVILGRELQEGGFRDKPGKHRDYYHTCYCLSGLSVAQYSYSKDADSPPLPRAQRKTAKIILGNIKSILVAFSAPFPTLRTRLPCKNHNIMNMEKQEEEKHTASDSPSVDEPPSPTSPPRTQFPSPAGVFTGRLSRLLSDL